MRHGVDYAEQGIGEGHTGKALGIMHGVALCHITIVGIYQIVFNHLYGEYCQRIGIIAMRGGNIGFDSVGHGVHTGVGNQLLGHGLGQIGVNYCHVRGDLEVRYGVLDALGVIGNDGERGYLGSGAGGGGNGAEVSLFTQLGQAEHLAHILEGYLGVFILYPHGLGRIYRRAAAHGNYPIRLELEHGIGAAHNGLNGGIGLDTFKKFNFHASFLQIRNSSVEESEFLHAAAANANHCALAFKCFQRLKGSFSVVKITG